MNSHLSKTEYRIMEYFWSTGGKYTFGELMKYFNEKKRRDKGILWGCTDKGRV